MSFRIFINVHLRQIYFNLNQYFDLFRLGGHDNHTAKFYSLNHKIVANFRLKLITSAICTLYYIRNYVTLNLLLLLLSLTLRNDARGVRREQEVNPLSVSHPLVGP